MAEGGYDPTTENETPWEDHGIDHDDDDEVWNTDLNVPADPEKTQAFEPGASSTPYHEGEAHEMVHLPQEEEGLGDKVPFFKGTDFSERMDFVNKVKNLIKRKFPRVNFKLIDVGIGSKKNNEGKPVAIGSRWGEMVVFKQDGNFTTSFLKQYSDALGSSAEE